jgi:hypothetical protein
LKRDRRRKERMEGDRKRVKSFEDEMVSFG